MIDRIVMQINGVAESLIDEKLPDVLSEYDDSKNVSSGNVKNLRFTYYHKSSTLRIEGSIHKFIKGNNYCRYTFNEAVETLRDLGSYMGIPLSAFRITSIELGVNIQMSEAPMKYIEPITHYKSNKFLYMPPRSRTSKIYGKKCRMAEYGIKFYDKIQDYIIEEGIKKEYRGKLLKNILRYEVQLSRKELITFGFEDPTAENLCTRRYAIFCANLLHSIMDEIIFIDNSIDYTKIPHKYPKSLHNIAKEYIFVTSDGYSRYLDYLKEHVGEDEYKKAKRSKARLLKKVRPFLLGKYEKELKEKFAEELSLVHDYKRAIRSRKV